MSYQGGLRTCGYYKTNEKEKPLITVVTVVLNGIHFLEETILSVLNQSYDNVEYIILDGGSTDGTLAIIKKYEKFIDYWVSCIDNGVYDGMNKGIHLATGEWINFMNGGDVFYNVDVLNKFINTVQNSEATIAYGDHQVRYVNGRVKFASAGKVNDLWKGSQFCHQATLTRLSYHKENLFNISNKIVADFEFFYKSWKQGVAFEYVPLVICSFQAGGVSDVQRIDAVLGWWSIVDKTSKTFAVFSKRLMIEQIKFLIKKLFKILF